MAKDDMGHDYLIYVTKLLGTAKRGHQKKTFAKGVNALLEIRGQKKDLGEKEEIMKNNGLSIWIQILSSTTGGVQPNRLGATNANFRRKNSAFRRRTNTYAKDQKSLQRTVDVSSVIRNLTTKHFLIGVVAALAQGITEEKLEIQSLFALRFCA